MAEYQVPLRAGGHCRHYSYDLGIDGGAKCAVGVDVSAPGFPILHCCPSSTKQCDRRENYTDDERLAWNNYLAARMQRLGKAVQALPAAIPLRTGGVVECPNCGGSLHYSRWHRGSEIHCDTPNCCGAHFNIAAGADWPARGKADG